MMAIVSIGIANVLVLLRVLALWENDRVRSPRKLSKRHSSNASEENYAISLGRILPEFFRDDLHDALDMC
jgi:hypothetical protein